MKIEKKPKSSVTIARKMFKLFLIFLAAPVLAGQPLKIPILGLNYQPGVICGRLLVMTQTAQTIIIPTHMTMTVAIVGTIMFKSSHSGSPGNRLFPVPPSSKSSSPAPNAPPIFSVKLKWDKS